MAFQKCQISFFNNILISTSAPRQQVGHAVCHLNFFRNWIDSRDHFKKSETDLGAKSVKRPNRKMAQNVGIKSVFTPTNYSSIMTHQQLYI